MYKLGSMKLNGTDVYYVSGDWSQELCSNMLKWCQTQWGPSSNSIADGSNWYYLGAFCFRYEEDRTAFITTWE